MTEIFKTRKIDAKTLRQLAIQLGVGIGDMLALDQKVDPFYAKSGPAKIRNAEWVAMLWRDMGSPRIHNRGFNYLLMGKTRIPYDGRLYDGSKKDYVYFTHALEMARYQGLIPFEKIPDHKTRLHKNFKLWKHEDIKKLTDFSINFKWIEEKILGHFFSIWESYPQQDTICEVWIEKSSIVETLDPILRSYKANYIEGEGDISLTRCWEFTERVREYYHFFGIKKFRVFYISDFDPVGLSMPVSMARKVEYLIYKILDKHNIPLDEIDIRVEDMTVTPEQIKEFELKTTKVPKEKVTRKDGKKSAYATRVKKFHRIHGVEGVVELEALMQTDPEEIPRLMRERLSRYYDKEVDRWIDFEMKRVRRIIKTILKHADWSTFVEEGELKVDWSPLEEYVEAVEPPKARHNESSDWNIFWLLESKLDYVKQLLRYTQFRLNLKDEYYENRYPDGLEPEPIGRVEGKSISDEDFEKYLGYVAQKQQELREKNKADP